MIYLDLVLSLRLLVSDGRFLFLWELSIFNVLQSLHCLESYYIANFMLSNFEKILLSLLILFLLKLVILFYKINEVSSYFVKYSL